MYFNATLLLICLYKKCIKQNVQHEIIVSIMWNIHILHRVGQGDPSSNSYRLLFCKAGNKHSPFLDFKGSRSISIAWIRIRLISASFRFFFQNHRDFKNELILYLQIPSLHFNEQLSKRKFETIMLGPHNSKL